MLDFEIETVSSTESSSSENTLTVSSVDDPCCEQHKLHFIQLYCIGGGARNHRDQDEQALIEKGELRTQASICSTLSPKIPFI